MIYLGLSSPDKDAAIRDYCIGHEIKKVFIFSPAKFFFDCSFPVATETVEWAHIIEYKYFYRLLQEIDENSLVIVNECLRLQNRYDLTYNCLRHFLNRTRHRIIFQYLPIIDSIEDFMILFDFDTQSRWKREKFNRELLPEAKLEITKQSLNFNEIEIKAGEKLRLEYLREKEKLVSGIGLKDPHTIPRNLYLMSGKTKFGSISGSLFTPGEKAFIARNNRFKAENFQTYKDAIYEFGNYTVFEFPHNFIDFATFVSLARQTTFDVLTTDLKVDKWYLERYRRWSEEIEHAYANIQSQ